MKLCQTGFGSDRWNENSPINMVYTPRPTLIEGRCPRVGLGTVVKWILRIINPCEDNGTSITCPEAQVLKEIRNASWPARDISDVIILAPTISVLNGMSNDNERRGSDLQNPPNLLL